MWVKYPQCMLPLDSAEVDAQVLDALKELESLHLW